MKVKDLYVDSWCLTCKKMKSYSCTMGNYLDDDSDAIELPEACVCGGMTIDAPSIYPNPNVTILPPSGSTVIQYNLLTEGQVREMVRAMVAEELAKLRDQTKQQMRLVEDVPLPFDPDDYPLE